MSGEIDVSTDLMIAVGQCERTSYCLHFKEGAVRKHIVDLSHQVSRNSVGNEKTCSICGDSACLRDHGNCGINVRPYTEAPQPKVLKRDPDCLVEFDTLSNNPLRACKIAECGGRQQA